MNGCWQHYGTTNRKKVFHDSLKYGNYPVDTAKLKPSTCYLMKSCKAGYQIRQYLCNISGQLHFRLSQKSGQAPSLKI